MKLKQMQGMGKIAAVLLGLAAGPLWAGTEGTSSTYYGQNAGASGSSSNGADTFVGYYAGFTNTGNDNTFVGYGAGFYNTTGTSNTFLGMHAGLYSTGDNNTFLGAEAGLNTAAGYGDTFLGSQAGHNNTTGGSNTFLGRYTGLSNTTGSFNTFLGRAAGYLNQSGFGNVFVGGNAGFSETGSYKLYIDNCYSGGDCTSPFIYGEFDSHLLNINGATSVAANGVAKSQMHFSLDNGDYGGFLTSVLQNNFFVSSGARYDSGNWVQRSIDGRAVAAGSGSVGYRIFTSTGHAVGEAFDISTSVRLFINYNGEFGINGAPVAGHEIHTATGAYEAGGAWVDGSSRELKDEITALSSDAAAQALAALTPVTFKYKTDRAWQHVGFIAEDVPQLVAAPDRKGLAPMDIVAVLTKVVQEQKQELEEKTRIIAEQQTALRSVEERLAQIEVRLGAPPRHRAAIR